ncbi:MAG TPA: peptide chain release factor N(5)-glutamine methyltransferase [Thermomicrobiales bacterium]|nr:peptide chain release factor N(5)-glutamine methyltransferase [Thermomicrobiales bacterium]
MRAFPRVPRPASRPVPRTFWDAISDATARLEEISESPQLDAELLLRHVTGLDRVKVFLRYDKPLATEHDEAFEQLVARRAAGEPIPYIIGRRWFRTIELFVDRRALIPRPETERFVHYALAWLATHPGPRRVVDVGTGSGAIALALAIELGSTRPDVQIVATERYRSALDVAIINREQLGLRERVDLIQADLLAGIPGPFDLILANMPYLRPDQTHYSTELEPDEALFGGLDGFDLHRRLLGQAAECLAPGGLWVGELDPEQEELGVNVATAAMGRAVRVDQDYSGDARYLLVGDAPDRSQAT